MVNTYAAAAPFSEASYFFGANIPGKPIRYLLNPGGRPKLHSTIARAVADGFQSFEFDRVRRNRPVDRRSPTSVILK